MKRLGIVLLIGLVIGAVFWWTSAEMKDRKDPLNKADAYVFTDNGILYWFEFTGRHGHEKGTLHSRKIKEEIGEVPFMEEKDYPLMGTATEKGYEFKLNNGENMIFNAWFAGADLIVQKQGEKDNKLYKAVENKELNKYIKGIRQELQMAIDQSEEKEKNRLKKFFSDLNHVYGYLYSEENGSFQVLIKIDEALLEGELSGSLLLMTENSNKSNSYKETEYVLNGITDGQMVQFFTTVDGKATKLEGNFIKDANSLDLSFWTTDQKLPFHAVTEEEFKNKYNKSKKR